MLRFFQHSFFRWLASTTLLHWALPYLMMIVVAGTLAQKYIGLFESQKLFFSSIFLWVGFVPLPGGRLVIALLAISLTAKIILKSPWHPRSSGIFITHLGALTLLVGGLLTVFFSTEGYLVLERSKTEHAFADYHQRVLLVQRGNVVIANIPFDNIHEGKQIQLSALPFAITPSVVCRNCALTKANHLIAASLEKEDERNVAGLEVSLSGAAKDQYVLYEDMKNIPALHIGNDIYTLNISREEYPLPFTLTLLDAHMETHPGTMVARSYESTVLLQDGNIRQKVHITMNHPLRYKGYTIYQTSFDQNAKDQKDTHAVSYTVVRNWGRIFPYVASVTLCLGLLVHLCLKLPGLIRKPSHAA